MLKDIEVKALKDCHGILCTLENAGVSIVMNMLVTLFSEGRIPGTDEFLRAVGAAVAPVVAQAANEAVNAQ